MHAIQVVDRGKIRHVEAPAPTLQPGHVLVSPLLIALCGSDVHTLYYLRDEDYPRPIGTAGHEVIARVQAVDAPGSSLRPGDLVLALCPPEDAVRELFLTRAENALPLPNGRPPEHFLMGQQLGTVIYASKRLPSLLGKNVAVIGQGSAGLFFDAVCRRLGAQRVIGIDVKPARVAAALKMGATHAINNAEQDPLQAVMEICGGQLADVVIEASGEVETINLTPRLVRTYGTLLFFGVPRAERLELDFYAFWRKYCTTITIAGAGNEPGLVSFRQALDWIARGEIDVSPLLTHRIPLAQAERAYDLAYTRDDGAIKVVIEMPAYRDRP